MKYLIQVKISRSFACVRNIAMNTQTLLEKKETKSKFAPLFCYFATSIQIGRGNSYDFVCLVCLVCLFSYVPICDFCTQTILS